MRWILNVTGNEDDLAPGGLDLALRLFRIFVL